MPMSDEPTERVRERIEAELGADRIHGIEVTRKQGDTVYCVVSQSTTWADVDEDVDLDIPVLDVRTVIVDFDQDHVRVSDNGLWVPQDEEVATGMAKLLARTSTDLSEDTGADPVTVSAVEGLDVDMFLDREVAVEDAHTDGQHVDKMRNHAGINPSRSWGYGAGPPPEVEQLVERLEEVGLDPSDHLSRLVWGKKEPMDRRPRPLEELTGNYGIELQPRERGLVALDVDYPAEFPEEFAIPETFEVSSPHGDDTQRHVYLKCEEKDVIAEEIGGWAVQGVDWGDLWIGDRFLVGPGSQLSEFGCSEGDHERGERGGCSACTDENAGYYRVVNDAPIAEVSAEFVLDLLEDSDYEVRNGRADPDPPEPDDEDHDEDGLVCDNCGLEHDDEEALKVLNVAGSTRRICRGGCDA